MSAVTLQIPDDMDLALNVPQDELAQALLVAAAVKLFELGKISTGKAAELAGIPESVHLKRDKNLSCYCLKIASTCRAHHSLRDASIMASDFATTLVLRVMRASWCLVCEVSLARA